MTFPKPATPMPVIVRADARAIPLAAGCVDLVVTSPPYFGLRAYEDGGRPYAGQIGAESTIREYLDALVEVTRECVRALKPSGSIWVNLGDRYAASRSDSTATSDRRGASAYGRAKSLLGIPWRYALRCVDEVGLVLRAEVVWSKPNGLPESVTDRVRRSHETWFHFTVSPRYYSAVDEIREPHAPASIARSRRAYRAGDRFSVGAPHTLNPSQFAHSLGKLPGSVWEIPTQPLRVPAELGVDHFAAFPMEWPRRLILGWSPREVCTACGHGRRPTVAAQRCLDGRAVTPGGWKRGGVHGQTSDVGNRRHRTVRRVSGHACACPDTTAPTAPGVVLDPFGGTGTTALVAALHGRTGISIDASTDYCRLAQWRAKDPRQRAKAAAPPQHRAVTAARGDDAAHPGRAA
ncbi:DNA-methyltransferase [Actinokineospora sp. NPDC004072]